MSNVSLEDDDIYRGKFDEYPRPRDYQNRFPAFPQEKEEDEKYNYYDNPQYIFFE